MWIADGWKDYELLDCGGGEKLERWDKQILVRPDPQAIWETDHSHPGWRRANGRYSRSSSGGGHWDKGKLPESWPIHYKELTFQVKPMNFKHTGLFPEQAANWDFAMEQIRRAGRPIRVLNLFAYTGAFSVAALQGGAASVVNIDMARGALATAQRNHELNGLHGASFLPHDIFNSWGRLTRGGPYDLVILDPPSYQKGSFVAEKDYARLIRRLPDLLAPGGHALLCLNSPKLGPAFLQEQVQALAPGLVFCGRVPNPPAFADVSEARSLKVLLYRAAAAAE